MKTFDIAKLDHQIRFLQNQAQRLRDLKKVWAEAQATQMDECVETIRQVRQNQQMSTMSGKRLEENDLTPHLGKMHDV